MQKQPNKYPLLLVIYHPMQTWNSAMYFNMQVVVGSVRRTWMQKQKQLQWRRKQSLMEMKKQDKGSLLSIGEDTLKMWSCTVCVTIFVFRFYNIKKCKYTPKVKCICDTYIWIMFFFTAKADGSTGGMQKVCVRHLQLRTLNFVWCSILRNLGGTALRSR